MSTTLLSSSCPDDGDSRQHAITAAVVQMVAIAHLLLDDDTRLERDEAHIAGIAADFERRLKEFPDEHPVQTPLRVVKRGPKWLIIAGAYRYLAALRVGLQNLPCIPFGHDLDAAGKLVEQFRDNHLHKPYTQMEQARSILELRQLRPNLSQGQAARLLGIHASDAAKALKVINHYPADLHALIGKGDGFVPFSEAYEFAKLMERTKDEAKVRELTDKAVKGLLVRDDAVVLVGDLLDKNKTKKPKGMKIDLEGVTITVMATNVIEAAKVAATKLLDAIKRLEKEGRGPEYLPLLLQ